MIMLLHNRATMTKTTPLLDGDKLPEVMPETGGGVCVSIQRSVGMNRSTWHRLADTLA